MTGETSLTLLSKICISEGYHTPMKIPNSLENQKWIDVIFFLGLQGGSSSLYFL